MESLKEKNKKEGGLGMKKGKVKKFFITGGAIVTLGILGLAAESKAVKIFGNNGTKDFPLAKCDGVCTYLAAYEYYGNKEGVIAGEDNLNTIVKFQLGVEYSDSTLVSIKLTGAKFLAPGNWTDATQYCLVGANNAIIAVQNGPHTFPTDTLYLKFTQSASKDTKLTLALCDGEVGQPGGTFIDDMTKVQLDPNLGASCYKDAVVKIKWNYPNDCCEADFIKITAKSVIDSQPLNLTAELDTDNDFKTFIGNYTIRNACCTPGTAGCSCGVAGECFGKSERTPSVCEKWWVLGDSFDPSNMNVAKISFDLVSLYEEKGIKEIRFTDNKTKCTTTDYKTWHCESDCIPCPLCSTDTNNLIVEVNGNTELNPTLWTVANPKVTDICPIDPRVKDVCCNLLAGPAGAWYGGLEAIIPFVKNAPGYYTTIKLVNRYNKDAKVFFAVFSEASNNPMLLAVKQIPGKESIPAGGGLMITGADLASLFPSANWDFGQAVKLLIRVPSQAGCMSFSGTNPYNDATEQYEVHGTNCYNNPNDPFVEGYVVYDAPQGTRTVPLKFKSFKNGQYAQ
jgi:hypothetical protein